MPTILRYGPYRFFFYSNENGEPAHIHVERDDKAAKFWLVPVSLADNIGFAARELRDIILIVNEHQSMMSKAYHEFHG